MFISAFIVESRQEPNAPTGFVAAIILSKQRRLPFRKRACLPQPVLGLSRRRGLVTDKPARRP